MSKSTQELMLNALKEIKLLKRELAGYKKSAHEPIAIVGMGCRFPGDSKNPQEFWENLYNGKDCITQQENGERWNMDDLYDPNPDAPGKIYSKGLGIIDDVEKFDADFFGISPREADDIDPQQRLLLEVSHDALEYAGYTPGWINGSNTGVYVGIASADYAHLGSMLGSPEKLTPWQGIGNALSAAAGRLSYLFNLKGPAVSFDTACSSSLTALHYACQSLRQGECDMAISAGVHLVLNPAVSIVFAKARMLSEDGHCKTFDASADGYVRSEGCGVVLLKRLSDAEADGDNILAIIRGSALNQDGKSQGFTAPNESAQEDVIRAALKQAQLQPREVSYVEAHGTGTPLGDPIELGALNSVYCDGQNRRYPLLVGSVKTNLGHGEAVAGMAGVIKLIQSLRHRIIPPHINFKTPNPFIPWNKMAVQVTHSLTQWDDYTTEDGKLRAGLSGFAFTGTNVHVIFEEYKPKAKTSAEEESVTKQPWVPPLVLASAKNEQALQDWRQAMAKFLTNGENLSFPSLVRTLAAGRDHYKVRQAYLAGDVAEFNNLLHSSTHNQQVLGGGKFKPTYKIAFLFSGQGAQYPGMGQALYQNISDFRYHFDQAAAQLSLLLERDLKELMWGEGNTGLNQTANTQPALFALEYALAKTWMQWGIKPDCLVGHSVGEVTAACIAGVFNLEDACKVIVHRGRLMGATEKGSMLVVFADAARIESLLGESSALEICAYNGPENTVVGGSEDELKEFQSLVVEQGLDCRILPVEHAFHTRAMESVLEEYRQILGSVKLSTPRMRVLSNLNGQHSGKRMAEADYWVQQIRQPVNFLACAQGLAESGINVALEVGPGAALVSVLRDVAEVTATTVSTLQKSRDELQSFSRGLAQLYVAGLDLDWRQIMPIKSVPVVELPFYPFQRKVFWNETLAAYMQNQKLPDKVKDWLYQVEWESLDCPSNQSLAGEQWLVLSADGAVGNHLVEMLGQAGAEVDQAAIRLTEAGFSIASGGSEEVITNASTESTWLQSQFNVVTDQPLKVIVCTAQLALPNSEQQWAALTGFFLALAKTVQAASRVELWVVTESAYDTGLGQSVVKPEQAMVLGFAKNLVYELAGKMRAVIDLSDASTPNLDAAVKVMTQELSHPWLSIDNAQVYMPKLLRQESAIQLNTDSIKLNAEKFYVIAGGTGALGLAIAKWMASKGARHLALLSRSGIGDRRHELFVLEKGGVQLRLPTLDIANKDSLELELQSLRKERPIGGVIHAAGQFEICPLQELTTNRCMNLMANKILGIQWLDELTREDELEFFVGYSSIASVWGSAGNFHYTAANQVVDAVIQRRKQAGKVALGINWGPWAESGMVSEDSAEQAQKRGLNMMEKVLGTQVFGRLLGTDVTQMVVADIHWQPFRAVMDMLSLGGMFEGLTDKHGAISPNETDVALTEEDLAFKASLAESSDEEKAEKLLGYLKIQLARALQMEPDDIDDTQPLIEMGIDSLLAVEFKNRAVKVTEVDLPVVRLLGGASLQDVSQWLAEGYLEAEGGMDQSGEDDDLVEGVL